MTQHTQEESQQTLAAFMVGLLVGGLVLWVFYTPEPVEVKEIEVVKEVRVPDGEIYSRCMRLAYQFQNPDFWTGELEGPVPSEEIIKIVDHCLSNQE